MNLSEDYDVEPAAFKKRMRFTGRDSALVFVFWWNRLIQQLPSPSLQFWQGTGWFNFIYL